MRSTMARRLVALGLKPGDRIALIAETGPEFAALFFGAIYAGAWPVPLPLPTSFGGRDAYIDQLGGPAGRAAIRRCSSIPAELAGLPARPPRSGRRRRGRDWEQLRAESSRAGGRPSQGQATDDIAYLQYSSGSTRFPHGVAVTHRALLDNLARPWPRDGGGRDRSLRLLAAVVSRHGAGRLLALADRQPDLGRLSEDRGFRPPPAGLARPHQPQPGHDAQLFADLRLRHLRAARIAARPASPTASTCRAGGSPAMAPT